MTSSLQPRSAARGGTPKWDRSIPPPLRPLVRSYALGYASAVVPRLFTLVLQQVTARKSRGGPVNGALQPPRESPVVSLQRILRTGLDPQRFPAFCATLVGGSTLLEVGETYSSSFSIIVAYCSQSLAWLLTLCARSYSGGSALVYQAHFQLLLANGALWSSSPLPLEFASSWSSSCYASTACTDCSVDCRDG